MEPKRNRFFWIEGVTEREVVRSLNDENPSRLRTRKFRRTLVVFLAAVALALGVLALWPDTKVRSYLEFAGIAALIWMFLLLRKSVRLIADAPNELLDERQISVRDAAHTVAYRILALVSVIFVLLFILADAAETLSGGKAMPLILGFLLLVASLPSMVLAWNLPSEERSEAL